MAACCELSRLGERLSLLDQQSHGHPVFGAEEKGIGLITCGIPIHFFSTKSSVDRA